jgi:hypothetical protein
VTAQGLSRIAGGVALVAVLVTVGLVARSALRGSEHEFVPQLAGGPATGDLTGYLGRIDRQAGTIDVAEDHVGRRAAAFAVTDATSITVRGKQGSLGDLARDMPVRVFYEVRNDVKYVTAILVIETPPAPQASTTPASRTPAGDATPRPEAQSAPETRPADTVPVVEPKPVAEAKPIGDARSLGETRSAPDPKSATAAKGVTDATPTTTSRTAPGDKAPGEKAVVAATTPPPAAPTPPASPSAAKPSAPTPAPPAAPAPVQPPSSRALSSPAPSVSPLAAAPATISRPIASPEGAASGAEAQRRPAESDVADGTAAIDWLLRESGRR